MDYILQYETGMKLWQRGQSDGLKQCLRFQLKKNRVMMISEIHTSGWFVGVSVERLMWEDPAHSGCHHFLCVAPGF